MALLFLTYRLSRTVNTLSPEQLSENAHRVAEILKQIANPNRLMILCALAQQELSVSQLNQQIDLSQSALSQHLAKLREHDIVSTRRASQTIYYCVTQPSIKVLLETLYREFCSAADQ